MISQLERKKVLVIGYRKALCDALERRNIPYALWDENLKNAPKAIHYLQHAFPTTATKIKSLVQQFLTHGPFTHVIAGTEASVYPASVSRRALGARKSKDHIVLSCHDKLIMKTALKKSQIPMADYIHPTNETNTDEIIQELGLPVVIKERKQSGGRGTIFTENKNTIQEALSKHKIFERFIDAPEASVETFINNGKICFVNITQYYRKKYINIVPGLIDHATQKKILALNQTIIRELKLSWGMTHLEVYLTPEGPLFGEIALRPPGGYIMELLSNAYHFNPWDAFLAVELDEAFHYPVIHTAHSAVIILHPGAGQVTDILGLDLLKTHPAIKKINLKIKKGSQIIERSSVGKDIGYLILVSKTQEDLINGIHFVDANFKIIVQ